MTASTWVFLFLAGGSTSAISFDVDKSACQATPTVPDYDLSTLLALNNAALRANCIKLIDLRAYKFDVGSIEPQALVPFIQASLRSQAVTLPLDAAACVASILRPDQYIVALGMETRSVEDFAVVNDAISGKTAIRDYQAYWDIGSSTWIGGAVFRNGSHVACYSYNARLWNKIAWNDMSDAVELNDFPV